MGEKSRHRRRPLSPQQKVEHAITLLNEVVEERARELDVPRLSPLHVNIELGHSLKERRIHTDQLLAQVNTGVRAQVPTYWRKGTVYCFHSQSAISPPDTDQIFTGYDVLGRPQWGGFIQGCLEAQVERLDLAYSETPQPVGFVQSPPFGARLIPELTGGKLYEVLGQLMIGPLNTRFRAPRTKAEGLIFSVQVILSQPDEGPMRLRLNLMGLTDEELYEGAASGPPRGPLEQARTCIGQTQRRVRKIEDQVRLTGMRGRRLHTQINQILTGLKDALLRVLNENDQRTQHARHRHHHMDRPTGEAWRDASRAGDERLFFDTHQQTIVVIGPKRRVHVFSEEGLHVTSMRLGSGELERKSNQKRWRPLDLSRMSKFRSIIRNKSTP